MGESILTAAFASQVVGQTGQAISSSTVATEQSRFTEQQIGFQRDVADLRADDVETRAGRAIELHRRRVSQTAGAQRAALAAQGVDVGTGSAAQVQQETFKLGAEDLAEIRRSIFREAWGIRAEVGALETTLGIQRAQRGSIKREAIVSAGLGVQRAGTRLAVMSEEFRRDNSKGKE